MVVAIFYINELKVKYLGSKLKDLGIEVIHVIEGYDPQFISLKRLSNTPYLKKEFIPILSLLNALISYQLSCRGEEYWNEFSINVAKYLNDDSDDIVSSLINFLKNSRCNRIQVNAKIKRLLNLKKASFIKKLLDGLQYFSENLEDLWITLSNALKVSKESKTVVFSIKMFYYGWKAVFCTNIKIPPQIPIPVDRRVAKVTYNAGLIRPTEDMSRSKAINLLISKYRKLVIDVWFMVSKISYIPPLNLDSLVWLSLNESTMRNVVKRINKFKAKELMEVINVIR